MNINSGGGPHLKKNYLTAYATAAIVLGLDQWTKWLILQEFNIGESTPLIGKIVSLTCRVNTGAAFGTFAGGNLPLAIATAIVTLVLLVWGPYLLQHTFASAIALGAILGGATGNLLDRFRLGHVVDFIDLHFWPVFNVADIGITVGALALVVTLIWCQKRCSEQAEAEGPPGQ